MTKPNEWVPDEWEVIEYVREVLADIRGRATRGQGVELTPDECIKVFACVVDPPFPTGRPPKNGAQRIRHYCQLLERKMPRARAVAETAKRFGCSKWVVNKACRERGTG